MLTSWLLERCKREPDSILPKSGSLLHEEGSHPPFYSYRGSGMEDEGEWTRTSLSTSRTLSLLFPPQLSGGKDQGGRLFEPRTAKAEVAFPVIVLPPTCPQLARLFSSPPRPLCMLLWWKIWKSGQEKGTLGKLSIESPTP